jgi:hypothetical protein
MHLGVNADMDIAIDLNRDMDISTDIDMGGTWTLKTDSNHFKDIIQR